MSERDEHAEICRDGDGNPEPDSELRDFELVLLAIIRKRRFLNFGRRGLGGVAQLEPKVIEVAFWERLLLKFCDDGLKVPERANG
jgi:hypothetical protein